MFKAASIREMRTPAIHQKRTLTDIHGREQETWTDAEKPNIRGKFTQKQSPVITANGLGAVEESITFVTWYKADIESGDKLIINGKAYKVNGIPDDTNLMGRQMVISLKRVV